MDEYDIYIEDYIDLYDSCVTASDFTISKSDSITISEYKKASIGGPFVPFEISIQEPLQVLENPNTLIQGYTLPDRSISISDVITVLGHLPTTPIIYPKSIRDKVKILLSEQLGRMATDQEVDNGILNVDLRGLISGFDINTTDLSITDYDLGNTTTLSSGATAFQTGPTGAPTATINQDGSAVFTNVNITGRILTIDNTQSIQTAINDLGVDGGTVHLKSGVYNVTTDLNIISSTTIEGDSFDNTIINFGGTASSIKATGTNVYTTGTIDSVAWDGGVGAFKVTGNGTSWLANANNTMQIFLGTRWYKIASVSSNTILYLSEGYGDTLTMPGLTYRIATPIEDILLSDITVTGSTTHGINLIDCRYVSTKDVYTTLNFGNGIKLENVMGLTTERLSGTANGLYGFHCTNSGFGSWNSIPMVSNGWNGTGGGYYLNNVKTIPLSGSASDANTGKGLTILNSQDLIMTIEAAGNSGIGIDLVSGNENIVMNSCLVTKNGSDGIKITNTTNNFKISGSHVAGNGTGGTGYGINIVNSACTNTNISGANDFATNASGPLYNGGLNTLIRGNVGLEDLVTGAVSISSKTYTSFENSTRFSITTTGAGTSGFLPQGYWINGGGGGGGDSVKTIWITNSDIFSNNPTFGASFDLFRDLPNNCSMFVGLGEVSVGGTGHTWNSGDYIGFKIVGASLYATSCKNGTNVDVLLATATNEHYDVSLKLNGTSSVDFYYRIGSGSFNIPKTLDTTNIPTLITGSSQISFSDGNTSDVFESTFYSMSFER